jgi:hypothetical protein
MCGTALALSNREHKRPRSGPRYPQGVTYALSAPKVCAADSKRHNHLRPDGNHANAQSERGKGSRFLNTSAKHSQLS